MFTNFKMFYGWDPFHPVMQAICSKFKAKQKFYKLRTIDISLNVLFDLFTSIPMSFLVNIIMLLCNYEKSIWIFFFAIQHHSMNYNLKWHTYKYVSLNKKESSDVQWCRIFIFPSQVVISNCIRPSKTFNIDELKLTFATIKITTWRTNTTSQRHSHDFYTNY